MTNSRTSAPTLGAVAILVSLAAPGGPLPAQGFNRMLQRTMLVQRFDKDKNGRLDASERKAARQWLAENRRSRRGRGNRRRGGPVEADVTHTPPIKPTDVRHYPKHKLYDETILRTVFLDFPQKDWHEELLAFYRTDVDVPATMVVDGKKYTGVGVRYRGSSSYLMVPAHKKKSMNISIDFTDRKQRLYGNRTLNLTNANADASFLRQAMFAHIARHYVPMARINYVRVVINGQNHGVYVNIQQFNRDFLADHFGSRKGIRWKVERNFHGIGALMYLGEDPAEYGAFNLKTKGDPKAMERLIRLTRLLSETPPSKAEAVLPEVLAIDQTLWLLALEFVFRDADGYVRQGYDYRIYEDKSGRFHPIPYDNNEILQYQRNRGRRGRGRNGQRPIGDDPLEQMDYEQRPLISRLLQVPAWRARYLAHVRYIADHWLDWKYLGPVCRRYHDLIKTEVEKDPKKLYSYEGFLAGPDDLAELSEERRQELLQNKSLAGPWPAILSLVSAPSGDGNARRLQVRAKVGGKARAEKVLLYFKDRKRDRFTTVAMADDGKHGDGAANDGVFGAETKSFKPGKRIYYYVEARAAEKIGTTTFHPHGAASQPASFRFKK